MFSSHSAEIDLNIPCRSLTALRADKLESRFLVGSCSVQNLNSVYLCHYNGELNEITLDATLSHDAGPIQNITSSPTDLSLFLTVAEQQSSACVWRLPAASIESSGHTEVQDLEEVAKIEIYEGSAISDVDWRDNTDDITPSTGDIAAVDRNGRVTRWDLSAGGASAECVQSEEGTDSLLNVFPKVRWDPHGNGNSLAVSQSSKVKVVDWRSDTSIPSGTVESFTAHKYGVCDVDYNPNKPFVMATAGKDGLVKYWDLRSAKRPLLVSRGGHSHWVTNVKYNPFHDQLVLTAGTDSVSNLWRVSTISSAPLLAMNDVDGDASETSAPDVRVSHHDHSESVYASCWGAADAWIYGSISYEGKLKINQVPSKEKYKILL